MMPSFAAVRLLTHNVCGSGVRYEFGGHFDADDRKTYCPKVTQAKRPGLYGDGGGLYLQVTERSSKSWIFRYWIAERDPATGELVRHPRAKKLKGRIREMGLGSCATVSLAEARDRALECRKLREKEVDPIEAREEARRQRALERARSLKFKEAAAAYVAAHRVAWKNDKHAAQWTATLQTYACPLLGEMSVHAIDTTLIMKVIDPIWAEKPETANRVRGRIESILDWATVRGYRQGENPARWRGHLDKLLPSRSKVRKTQHHSALLYAELPAFMKSLRHQEGVAARALEFTILTAARTGETISARRSEFNSREKLWTVPAERMKAGKEHRVPLSDRALELIATEAEADNEFIFPGGRLRRPLSNMAMLKLLERMGRDDLTVHGFRSTFRDWASERTDFPAEVVEMALAHAIDSKTEAAYRRGDLFEKRRDLMNAWAQYCLAEFMSGAVISLKARPTPSG
jgi:integrase